MKIGTCFQNILIGGCCVQHDSVFVLKQVSPMCNGELSCCQSCFLEFHNLKDRIESDILQAPPCVNYDKGPVAKNNFHLYQLAIWSSGVNFVIQPWKLNELVSNELGWWKKRFESIFGKNLVDLTTGYGRRHIILKLKRFWKDTCLPCVITYKVEGGERRLRSVWPKAIYNGTLPK